VLDSWFMLIEVCLNFELYSCKTYFVPYEYTSLHECIGDTQNKMSSQDLGDDFGGYLPDTIKASCNPVSSIKEIIPHAR